MGRASSSNAPSVLFIVSFFTAFALAVIHFT
jgi:hypothetical protein